MSAYDSPYYYRDPDELPTPLNIPVKFRQNETPSWDDDVYQDVNGNSYNSSQYTLTYVLVGPISSPVQITATANGLGFTTSLTPTIAATLVPGLYGWQGVLTATNFRMVAGEGQLTVEADFASLTGVYDGRTVAQKALAACENALSTFNASNGMIKRYTIDGRTMEFQDVDKIIALMNTWRERVSSEQDALAGGKSRNMLLRFSRAH